MNKPFQSVKKTRILSLSLCTIFFTSGCFQSKENESPIRVRPIKDQQSVASHTLASMLPHYREGKWPIFLKQMSEYLEKNPQDHEARLFQALALARHDNLKQSQEELSKIPKEDRELLTDSCMELREMTSKKEKEAALLLASNFFPDCIEEIQSSKTSNQTQRIFSEADILNLGKEYDAAISQEDDEEIRRKKEEAFQKKHNLNDAELEELTARYLELLSSEE